MQAARQLAGDLCALGADLAVVDSYFVTGAFLGELKKYMKTACFYAAEEKVPADCLINYNVNYNSGFYREHYNGGSTKLLLGSRYIPLRQEFSEKCNYKGAKQARAVLALTGGSDGQDFIRRFIRCIPQINGFQEMEFTCVIGSYSPYYEAALQECRFMGLNQVHILKHTPAVAELMKKQDLIISAGGTTVYELCALGIPTVLYSVAPNQVMEAAYLQQKGILPYAGDCAKKGFWENLVWQINRMAGDLSLRRKVSRRMSGLADGKGADRIASELLSLAGKEGRYDERI